MDAEHKRHSMSIEYNLHADGLNEEVLSFIFKSIKDSYSAAQFGRDGSLWIPSSNPKWIDFSVEKSNDGLFIVSNSNGTEREKLFSLIELILTAKGVAYSIEEI